MDNEAIRDMFQALGPVTIKRMFGGKGIYHQGRILAAGSRWRNPAEGRHGIALRTVRSGGLRSMGLYRARTSPVKMPYWSVPDSEALDDPDVMKKWVQPGL